MLNAEPHSIGGNPTVILHVIDLTDSLLCSVC